MKIKKNKTAQEAPASWKTLFKFYRKVKLPWGWLLVVFLMSFAVKEAQSLLVPYTSKLQTGAIEEAGFLWGYVLMSAFYGITEAVQGSVNEFCGVITARNVRHTVWHKLIHLPMKVFHKEDPQRFVSRVTQDTTGAYAAVACVIQLWSVIFGIYTNFARMYKIYKTMALIMLTAIPMTILASWICGKLQFSMERITNSAYAAITNFFGERLPNLLHIKTCSMEDAEYRKGIEANEAKYRADVRRENRFIFTAPIGAMAQHVNQIILLVVASALVRSGSMKMFQLVNLYNYFLLFMSNTFMITAVWQSLKLSHGACSTIARLAEMEDEKLDGPVAVEAEGRDITFENVSFAYTEGTPVLKDISFVIPKGKVTAIVGENGSGKSTIVKLLERFTDPSSGTIRLGDADLQDVNLQQWRDAVGYLSQTNQMVKGSLRENICYGLDRAYTEEELIEAAQLARAYEFIQAKEEGFDAQISQFETKLSGGELQRLAIARIIMRKPQYLIMDEATSGIDVVSEQEVMEGIHALMENKTVIMVSHDMNLIKKADHIVVLNNGVIEASGSFDQVVKHSAFFHELATV